MTDEIEDLGRRINKLLGQFPETGYIPPDMRVRLERLKQELFLGAYRIDSLLKDHVRLVPDQIVTETELDGILRVKMGDWAKTPSFEALELRLRERYVEHASHVGGTADLSEVFQTTIPPHERILTSSDAEKTKYIRVAQEIINFPYRNPRQIQVVIDTFEFTNPDVKGKRVYTIGIINHSIGHVKLSLLQRKVLEGWIKAFSLLTNLNKQVYVGNLVFPSFIDDYSKDTTHLNHQMFTKFGNSNVGGLMANYVGVNIGNPVPSYDEDRWYIPFESGWLTGEELKKGIEDINQALSKNGLPQLYKRAGQAFYVKLNRVNVPRILT